MASLPATFDLAPSAALAAVLLGTFGAVFGSFIAALVIRWPQDRSVMSGRSACDACGRVLVARDLVPLVSAAVARGKCRYCGAPIDPLHWRIEALGVVMGVSAGALAPLPAAAAIAVFGWLLLALAALDIAEFWLPDELTATLALAGLATGALGLAPPLVDRLIGGAGGFVALWLVGATYKRVRGRDGLGGGDPKLLGAIGLWLGWQALPVTLLLACLIGFGVVLFWMLTGRGAKMDDRLPFGALLAAAAYASALAMLGTWT
ncbi:MAG: prepilin peptidase [Sphingomonas sp.]